MAVANLQDIHFIVSPRMEGSSHTKAELEYEVMSSHGVALLWGFLDLKRPWQSVDETYKKGLFAGWLASIGPDGEELATPKDRLEN